jgi:hypothetical protein
MAGKLAGPCRARASARNIISTLARPQGRAEQLAWPRRQSADMVVAMLSGVTDA